MMLTNIAEPAYPDRHQYMQGGRICAGNSVGLSRDMPKRLYRHRVPRRMASGHEAPQVYRVTYAGSDVAVQGVCQERGGSVPERAGTCRSREATDKGDDGFLLCSDRHSSPGELRIAKRQTSAGKMPYAGQVPISGNVRPVPQARQQGPRSLFPF